MKVFDKFMDWLAFGPTLNEHCTGLYMVADDEKVGFELDEDYALFKLKFHGA